jgi:hypothetical protein
LIRDDTIQLLLITQQPIQLSLIRLDPLQLREDHPLVAKNLFLIGGGRIIRHQSSSLKRLT